VQNDKSIDGILNHGPGPKLSKLLDTKADAIQDYARSWVVSETEESLKEKCRELYEGIVLIYGASAQRPDKQTQRLDFFLMHGLASVYFAEIFMNYFTTKQRAMLLKAYFAALLSFYITRGRPSLYPKLLQEFTPKELKQEPNPWLDVIGRALAEEDDSHELKVVRSLLLAEQKWGGGEYNINLKVAQLTVEGYAKNGWSRGGLGWEEEWN